MAKIQEIISSLKEKEKFYIENYQPEWMFADEVVSALSEFEVAEYKIFDIFSKEIIQNYILASAKDHLIANLTNGKVESYIKVNSDKVKKMDHSDLARQYIKLLNDWEKAGWIRISKSENTENELAIELNVN